MNVITPFILMGAMGPVSIPAALAQQTAEALAGMVLTQLVRPGAPAIMGSFVSHSDMQSGSPGFGGPESAIGLLVSGQIARRYGLLWRAGGGGLTSAITVDAQAAAESLNTLTPAFLAGANLMLHAAGWLESGLVSCFEKYMLDIELLRILREQLRPLEIDEESLAFGAHDEVRHGGHFFGAAHTLERFRTCFYRPIVFSTENFDRWNRLGQLDTAARAAIRWQEALATYEQPPLDDGIPGRARRVRRPPARGDRGRPRGRGGQAAARGGYCPIGCQTVLSSRNAVISASDWLVGRAAHDALDVVGREPLELRGVAVRAGDVDRVDVHVARPAPGRARRGSPVRMLTTPAGTSEVATTSASSTAASGCVSEATATAALPPTSTGAMRVTRPASGGSSGASDGDDAGGLGHA